MDRNIIRYSSYCIVLVLWLVGACNAGAPTAVITDSTGEQISVKYALVGEWVHFYGDESFDNDPEPENDQYVEAWGWTWSRYHEPTKFDGPQTCHFSCYWDTPGTRYIYLAVRDDEGVWSNYLMCTVHVVNISLQITSPTGLDRDVAFNDASTGVCEFTATGTTGVTALDDFLEWELTGIDGSTLTIIPDPQQGAKVSTFKYEGLPSENSEFGPKTLTLRLDYPDIYREVTATIRVFYEPDAENHPVLQDQGEGPIYAGTPNWFYYFRKDGVVDDMIVIDNGVVKGFFYQYSDQFGGWYDPDSGSLFLSSKALEPWNANWPMKNKWYGAVINAGADGEADSYAYAWDDQAATPSGPYDPVVTPGTNGYLEWDTICNYWGADDEITLGISQIYDVECDRLGNVAYTITHEMKHRTLYMRMAEPGAVDSDGDNVEDNDYEGGNSSYKLCPYCCPPPKSSYGFDTYNIGEWLPPQYPQASRSDQEFVAYMSEVSEGPKAIDEEKDWSKEGRQWHE